jgi:hypothetical protein
MSRRGSRKGSPRGSQKSGGPGVLLAVQDRVHGSRAGLDDGPELVAVNGLGDDRRPVSDQVGDRLDGNVVVAHDRDEGVA